MALNELELALNSQSKSANINTWKVMEHLANDTIIAYRLELEAKKTIISVISILNWSIRRLKMDVYVDWDNSPQVIVDNRDRLDSDITKKKIHELLTQNHWILARVEHLDTDNMNQLLFLYYILLTNNWYNVFNKVEV